MEQIKLFWLKFENFSELCCLVLRTSFLEVNNRYRGIFVKFLLRTDFSKRDSPARCCLDLVE